MADRIHASSEWLNKCARDLNSIENAINNASRTLSGINLRRDEGGNLRASLTCSLRMNGAGFSGNCAAEDIRALQRAAASLSGAAAGFSRGASNAARIFEDAENKAIQIMMQTATGSGTDDDSSILLWGTAMIGGAIAYKSWKDWKDKQDYEARKSEFLDILKTVEPGGKPLDNPRIVEIMDEELKKAGYSESDRNLFMDRLRNVPADYSDIYIYSFYEYTKHNGKSSDGLTGVYKHGEKALYADMSSCTSDQDKTTLFFHESGHAVDRNSDSVSLDTEIPDKILADATNYYRAKVDKYAGDLTESQKTRIVNAFVNGDGQPMTFSNGNPVAHAPSYLSDEEKRVFERAARLSYYDLNKAPKRNSSMVSDVMSGMTNNAASGRYGHDFDGSGHYWYSADGTRTNKQSTEGWAEYYSSIMAGDTTAENLNRQYFPETTAYMDQHTHVIAEQYRNRVRNS